MIRLLGALLVAAAVTPHPAPSPSAVGARSPMPTARASAPAARASNPPAQAGASFDLGVWTVHASSVDANFKTGTFSTKHKVVMTRHGGDVTADRADGNYKKKLVNLYGHVVMHDDKGDYGGLNGPVAPGHAAPPSTLTADRAQIDGEAKIYKAFGHVHYVQTDTDVTADQGTLNDATHELYLKGNVHVKQGPNRIDSATARYNTITGVAHAQGNVIIRFPGHFTRGIATPRPIGLPKNPLTEPVVAPSASP